MVTVRNLATGRTVTVRINNRGPFRKGRLIDVSKRAAQQLGMIQSGVAQVEVAEVAVTK
jgi:rare lipoprotein A